MSKELEPQPVQSPIKAEITAEPGYPVLSFSPVEWFDHLLKLDTEYSEQSKSNPVEYYGRHYFPEEIVQASEYAYLIHDWRL